MKVNPEELYKRQITLPEIGLEGQQKLRQAKVVIIGCGGLGSVAATYLAATGIGRIHLIDFDTIDLSNLHRQVFYKFKDVGKLKVKILAKHLRKISPIVKVSRSKQLINKSNIFDAIEDYDIVLDCTDHLPTKYLINDACVIKNKILIYGSLYKYTGYVASFNVPNKESRSANLRDAFPDLPTNHIPNCAEIGTLNTIVGLIGLQQVNEVIKLITGIGHALFDTLLIYNSLDNSQHHIKLLRKTSAAQITTVFETSNYVDALIDLQNSSRLINAAALKQKIKNKDPIELISVIEDESTILPFDKATKIPYTSFSKLSSFIAEKSSKNSSFVLVCKQGITSYNATERLRSIYPHLEIFSLAKGINNY